MPAFPNPFPGLRPFEAADRDRFFGRDLQVQELGKRLAENRVITIIGGSGCGKSSLVRAGLLPALTGLGISSAGRIWQPVGFIPGRVARRAGRPPPPFSLARAVRTLPSDQ